MTIEKYDLLSYHVHHENIDLYLESSLGVNDAPFDLEADGLGLIVQGGGMRGLYSSAALLAVSDLLGVDRFRLVGGSSAGAINAAYFAAGQAETAPYAYLEPLASRKFIKFRGLSSSIVDIDFLIDEIVSPEGMMPLDLQRLSMPQSPECVTVVTRIDGVQEYMIINELDQQAKLETLRATAALPILYGKHVDVGGVAYLDGGLVDPLPINYAIDQGLDQLIVILTRPIGFNPKPLNKYLLSALKLHPLSPPGPILDLLRSGPARSVSDYLTNRVGETYEYRGARLLVVAPSAPEEMATHTTTNRERLHRTAQMAYADVEAILGRHGKNPWS